MDSNILLHNKKAFIKLAHKYIQRSGLDQLLDFLESSDFYVAPSSTKFHLNEAGGLCKHSMNVFETSLSLLEHIYMPHKEEGIFNKNVSIESLAICTLFHDICKINQYQQKEKWKKDQQNKWYSYQGYETVDNFPFGHGEKSCIMLHTYMKLTKEELLSIRWHMGMFDMGEQGSGSRMSFYAALKFSPLVALTHAADFLSSNLLEPTLEF